MGSESCIRDREAETGEGDGRRAMSGGDSAVSNRSVVEFFGVVGGPAGDSGNSEKRNVCGEAESP